MDMLAILSIICGTLSLLCLLALHFVSPEFSPSWRMVSEYALGRYKLLLAAFFFLWGISSVLIAMLLWNVVTNGWSLFGVILVFISGIGAIMGGLFDVNHKWHGLAFSLGIPTLLVGSLFVCYNLIKIDGWQNFSNVILIVTHSVWISCVLMAVTMGMLFSAFKKAGIAYNKDSRPPKELPKDMKPLNGYANRLTIFCYIIWNISIAYTFLST